MEQVEKTNLFYAMVRSIYSMSFYREVASDWSIKRSLGYLAIVAVLFWVVIVGIQSYRFLYKPLAMLEQMADQFPIIKFENSTASAEQTKPIIVYSKTNSPLVIIDTKDQITNVFAASGYVFVQSKGVIVKGSEMLRAYPYSAALRGMYGPKEIKHSLKLTSESIFPFAVFILWIFYAAIFFVIAVISAYVIGIFGRIYALIIRRTLHYRWVVRMALIASVPALILAAILGFLHINFLLHLGIFVYLACVLAYVFIAVYKMPAKN